MTDNPKRAVRTATHTKLGARREEARRRWWRAVAYAADSTADTWRTMRHTVQRAEQAGATDDPAIRLALDTALRGAEVAYYVTHCLGTVDGADFDNATVEVIAAEARVWCREMAEHGDQDEAFDVMNEEVNGRARLGRG